MTDRSMTVLRNKKQLEVINTLTDNILLMASAGTGKTDTLAERVGHIIAAGKALPEEILCLTFTNKACRELKDRIIASVQGKGLKVTVRTFHSFCYDIIKTEAKKHSDLFADFIIFDEEDCSEIVKDINKNRFSAAALQNFINLVKQYRAIYDIYTENSLLDYDQVVAKLFGEKAAKMKQLCVRPDYAADEKMQQALQKVGAEIVNSYNRQLQDMHGLDFNDLTTKVYELFKEAKLIAGWQKKYKYLSIDEMQDTSEVEYKILSPLFYGNNVLLCGDYFQTIYEWRGSTPMSILPNYINDFRPQLITFDENYRATQTLLKASYGCLQNMFGKQVKDIYRQDIKAVSPLVGDPITLKSAGDVEAEAGWIFGEIQKIGSEDISKICILTRSNKYNLQLSECFRALNSRLPNGEKIDFILADEFKFFRRQEIKDVMAFLKLTVNRHDANSLKRILKRFAAGIGEKTLEIIESGEFREAGVKTTDFIDPKTYIDGDPFSLLLRELEKENVVVFDVESTGINTAEDEIVQIAAVRLDHCGKEISRFVRFLKPTKDVGAAAFVHGFTDEYLQQNGEDPRRALNDFVDFSRDAVVVGHNVGYDISILTSQLSRLGQQKPTFRDYYDTLDIFRRFYPNLANHKLEFLSNYFAVEKKPTHNALDDILATAALLMLSIEKNIRPMAIKRKSCIEPQQKKFLRIATQLEMLIAQSYRLRPYELIAKVVEIAKIDNFYKSKEQADRVERIRDLFRLAKQYDDNKLTPRDALQELLKLAALSNTEMDIMLAKIPKIPIVTVHQAKGSEFECEFLAGLQENTFPTFPAVKKDNLEEEKRLFYVAVTRAKKKLYLSWSKSANGRAQTISRFIKTIPAEFIERQ